MINKIKFILNIAIVLVAVVSGFMVLAPQTASAARDDAGYIYMDGNKYYFYSYETGNSKRWYPPSASSSNTNDDDRYASYSDPGCKPGFTFSQTSGLRCPVTTSGTTSPYYNTGSGSAYYTPVSATTTPVNGTTSNTTTTSGNSKVNQTPVIYSVTPNTALSKSNEIVTLKITGNNFISTSIAKWNGSNRETIYVNGKELAMKLTSADVSGLGDYLVTVFNQAPGGGYSNSILFNLNNGVTGSALSANVANSSNGLHIGVLGWIMIIIFVILIVILWRKFYLQVYLQKKNEELERERMEKEELELIKKENLEKLNEKDKEINPTPHFVEI